MLRPSNSLLGSSRAARRRTVRAERVRALGHAARGLSGAARDLRGSALDLVLLCALPVLYLAAAYLVLDLPLRWLSGREAVSFTGAGELLAAISISLVGLGRALQQAPPIAPVGPRFARAMLAAGWIAALLLAVADLAA